MLKSDYQASKRDRMAATGRRRSSGSAVSRAARDASTHVTIGVTVQLSPETQTYYFNHAEVACIPHEFAIMFARMPTKLPPDRLAEARDGVLTLECELQVLLAPTLLPGLINAL